MGRTRDISYSFTFGFMDMVDYFIEEVRDGRCRRGTGFEELRVQEEVISPIRSVLPQSPTGRLLTERDCRYSKESRAAHLFETIYSLLLKEVFGVVVFGVKSWRYVRAQTGILVDFYHFFDKALLGDDRSWWGTAGRESLLRTVVIRVLKHFPNPESVPTWGSKRQVLMTHLFFQGKLPRFVGFDYGPFTLEGNRASIVQGTGPAPAVPFKIPVQG